MFFGYKLNETSSPIYSHLLRWNNTSRINNYLSDGYKEETKNYDVISIIEEQLKDKLEAAGIEHVALVEAAGPGFLNFRFKEEIINNSEFLKRRKVDLCQCIFM